MYPSLRAKPALGLILGLAIFTLCSRGSGADWIRFHGPGSSGASLDKQPLPATWSETENLKWKAKLPGPGSSSPIVVGSRVVVTCWSGYAANPDHEGDQQDLRRHVVCFDRRSGKLLWDREVEPVLPEDPYSGQFTQHGYASHTPVSDGKRVFVFFGKTGVLAFDLQGKRLWQTSVGAGSGSRGWGTASSPILYKDLVIVPASAESQSMVALDGQTGKEVWRYKDNAFTSTWGTPVLVDCGQGRTDLVMAVPYKIWGLDPATGKLRWHCDGLDSDSICTSAIADHGVVYVLETGPRGGGTIAVRAGGEGDVSKTHIVWRGQERTRIATPVLSGERIYIVNSRAADCLDAATGKLVFQTSPSGKPPAAEPPRGGGRPDGQRPGGMRPGGGRSGRGRGGMMGQDYSSPVLADGKIYFFSRSGVGYVYAAGAELKPLAQNHFAPGSGDFSATPAVSDGQLFVRSSKFLYCVEQQGQAD